MLDNILNSVKRGAERVQRRGEEVAHATRLRVEVFQLTRELDSLYARLGRSYHAGAEVGVLQGVREDIRRVEDEIRARERLIEELGGDPADAAEAQPDSPLVRPAGAAGTADPTVPHSDEKVTPGPDTASMGRDPQRQEHTAQQADAMKGHNDPLDR